MPKPQLEVGPYSFAFVSDHVEDILASLVYSELALGFKNELLDRHGDLSSVDPDLDGNEYVVVIAAHYTFINEVHAIAVFFGDSPVVRLTDCLPRITIWQLKPRHRPCLF